MPAEQAVHAQGDKLVFEFDRHSPQFCVYGDIRDHRDSHDYTAHENQPFCFTYTGIGNQAGFKCFE